MLIINILYRFLVPDSLIHEIYNNAIDTSIINRDNISWKKNILRIESNTIYGYKII